MSKFLSGEFPIGEYDQIQAAGLRTLREIGMPAPVEDIFKYSGNRRSLDINFKPPRDAQRAIEARAKGPLRRFFSEQFGVKPLFYRPSWLHLTFLQLQTAETRKDFDPNGPEVGYIKVSDEQENQYKQAVGEVLEGFPVTEISYSRVIRAPGRFPSIMLGGILPDNRLVNVRQAIDEKLDQEGLPHFRPRNSVIAQTNIMRDKRSTHVITPDDAQRVIDFIEELDGKEIWAGEIDTLRLVVGDYFMRPSKTQTLHTFNLERG